MKRISLIILFAQMFQKEGEEEALGNVRTRKSYLHAGFFYVPGPPWYFNDILNWVMQLAVM